MKVIANPPPRPVSETLRTPPTPRRSFERLIESAASRSTPQDRAGSQPLKLRPDSHGVPNSARSAQGLARADHVPAAVRAERAWRAFGFSELGVFGDLADTPARSAEAAVQGRPGQPQVTGPPRRTEASAPPAAVPMHARAVTLLSSRAATSGLASTSPADAAAMEDGAAAQPSAAAELGSAGEAAEPDAPLLSRRSLSAIARVLLARSGLQDRAQVQLTVIGDGPGLEVAVRARNLGDESRVRLRRALAEACQAHGLPLGCLILNGVSDSAPAPTFNGEYHGDRAR